MNNKCKRNLNGIQMMSRCSNNCVHEVRLYTVFFFSIFLIPQFECSAYTYFGRENAIKSTLSFTSRIGMFN